MCGRYRLTAKERCLRDHFGLDEDPPWEPHWNIAPTQQIPTIRQHPAEPKRIFGLKSPAFGVGYDALSRRSSLTRPNGVNTTYAYAAVSRLTSILRKHGMKFCRRAEHGNGSKNSSYLCSSSRKVRRICRRE